MKLWKHTRLDAILLMLSLGQFIVMFVLAFHWESYSAMGKIGSFALLTFMMTYNIIVISHVFTHVPWFESPLLNGLVSMLNSINIGQSVQAYHLTHVRNHHRYNNDLKGPHGRTMDTSSTFQAGKNGEHATLFHYAFVGAAQSIINTGRELFFISRLWRVGDHEQKLLELMSRTADKCALELQQLRLDRMAHFFGIMLFLLISWKWTLLCYLPAFYLALALVNMQNYYEHFGAMPDHKAANSVSYYGHLYNLFAFNDGHHQEHHLRPAAHWSMMPEVRRTCADELNQVERIISPVPAIIGFLDRKRNMLHNVSLKKEGVAE